MEVRKEVGSLGRDPASARRALSLGGLRIGRWNLAGEPGREGSLCIRDG